MKNKIRLFLTDLDDTLLTSDRQITEKTKDVFRKCKEQGILTGFATARAELPSKKYMDILQPDVRILNNGGLIKYKDQTIASTLMSAETVDGILAELKQIKDLGDVTVETDDAFYTSCRTFKESYGSDYAHGVYCDYSKPLHKASYKMTVTTKNSKAFYEIVNRYSECRGLGFAMDDWFCICPKDITKGAAVQKAAEYLNIPAAEIAAFGDDVTDLEMLRYSGYGVAMINGLPAVKAAGNYITKFDNDHDGVARFIEEMFLSK